MFVTGAAAVSSLIERVGWRSADQSVPAPDEQTCRQPLLGHAASMAGIQVLVDMGFDSEQAKRALRATAQGGRAADTNAAVDWLFHRETLEPSVQPEAGGPERIFGHSGWIPARVSTASNSQLGTGERGQTCEICTDILSDESHCGIYPACPSDGCGHRFHRACWSQFLSTKIRDGIVRDLHCPLCTRELRTSEVRELAPPADFDKYLQFTRNLLVQEDPDARWCPTPGCGTVLRRKPALHRPLVRFLADVCSTALVSLALALIPNLWPSPVGCALPTFLDPIVCAVAAAAAWWPRKRRISRSSAAANVVACFKCGRKSCFLCGGPPHGAKTCEEASNSQVHDWAAGHDTGVCPSCSAMIERVAGCNHMTCRCGYSFCWLCGARMTPGHFAASGCTQYHGTPKRNRLNPSSAWMSIVTDAQLPRRLAAALPMVFVFRGFQVLSLVRFPEGIIEQLTPADGCSALSLLFCALAASFSAFGIRNKNKSIAATKAEKSVGMIAGGAAFAYAVNFPHNLLAVFTLSVVLSTVLIMRRLDTWKMPKPFMPMACIIFWHGVVLTVSAVSYALQQLHMADLEKMNVALGFAMEEMAILNRTIGEPLRAANSSTNSSTATMAGVVGQLNFVNETLSSMLLVEGDAGMFRGLPHGKALQLGGRAVASFFVFGGTSFSFLLIFDGLHENIFNGDCRLMALIAALSVSCAGLALQLASLCGEPWLTGAVLGDLFACALALEVVLFQAQEEGAIARLPRLLRPPTIMVLTATLTLVHHVPNMGRVLAVMLFLAAARCSIVLDKESGSELTGLEVAGMLGLAESQPGLAELTWPNLSRGWPRARTFLWLAVFSASLTVLIEHGPRTRMVRGIARVLGVGYGALTAYAAAALLEACIRAQFKKQIRAEVATTLESSTAVYVRAIG